MAQDLAAVPRYEAFNLDIWAGAEFADGFNPSDLSTGLAVAFPILNRHLRPSVLVAPDRLGVGIAYVLIPMIEVSIGAGLVWNLDNGDQVPVAYASIYKF